MSSKATMRAAVYHGRGDIRISEMPIPTPGQDQLLLRILAAGICGTDAHEFASGPHRFPIAGPHPISGHSGPLIPGHEFAGEVVDKGSAVSGFEVGAVVASGAGISCGECHWCRRGATNLCPRYVTAGLQFAGGLAQYAVIPASICVDVASFGLSSDVAALAQPMAIAAHAMRRARLGAGEGAVILGAGGIGAFLTFAASRLGAEVIVVDLDERRLNTAVELGATGIVSPGPGPDLGAVLADRGLVPTVIFEATGTFPGLRLALDGARSGTRVVLVGIQGGDTELALRRVTLDEIELIGSNAHAFALDFPEALRLLASREEGWRDIGPVAIPLDDLVEGGLIPLVEGRAERIKTLIDPWADRVRASR